MVAQSIEYDRRDTYCVNEPSYRLHSVLSYGIAIVVSYVIVYVNINNAEFVSVRTKLLENS